MTRTKKSDLEFYVERINKLTGSNFCLGYAYGGVKLEAADGSVDISQRLSLKELYYQLVTIERVLTHAKRGGENE
jgi:hypothetical protein